MTYFDQIAAAAAHVTAQCPISKPIAIVLGSGLGSLAHEIENATAMPYATIPHFGTSSVAGHEGTLLHGLLAGREVLVMKGRLHYYEGWTMQQATLPIRVMRALGCEDLLLTNASGGMNPAFSVGDLMLITDHINLFHTNPLIGSNDERLGPRFPDMSEAYCRAHIRRMLQSAETLDLKLHKGVYAGVSGPCFETPAEYAYLRAVGADAVGMSTVPETIVAVHGGMKVAAVSVITDLGLAGKVEKVSHEEVQHAAAVAGPKLKALVKQFLTVVG